MDNKVGMPFYVKPSRFTVDLLLPAHIYAYYYQTLTRNFMDTA
ncbi:MAG: hypothetical protein ABIQ00_25750 [Chitinophagaceae bacterium]